MDKDKRIAWIDISKGIGIILVVLCHFIINIKKGRDEFDNQFISATYLFHMPFFFFISGYLFQKDDNNLSFICKQIRSLIIPYFSIAVLVAIIYYLLNISDDICFKSLSRLLWSGHSLSKILKASLTPMWFLTCLFCVRILYNLLATKTNCTILHIVIGILLIVSYLYGWDSINTSTILVYGLPFSLHIAFAALPIFHTAQLWKNYKYTPKHISTLGIIAIASAFYIPQNSYDMVLNKYGIPIITLVSAICAILLVIKTSMLINKKMNAFAQSLSYIGQASLMIMAFHYPIIGVIESLFGKISFQYDYLAMLVVVVMTSCLLYYIFGKFRITNILFLGKRSK